VSERKEQAMPGLEFVDQPLLPRAEFIRMLEKMSESYDPLEELLALERDLVALEQKYSLSSADFFQRYQAGDIGDEIEIIRWAGRYKVYLKLKQAISDSLKIVITTPFLMPEGTDVFQAIYRPIA